MYRYMSSINVSSIFRKLLLLWQPCCPPGHDDQGPGHLGEYLHGLLFLVLLAQCHPLLFWRLPHWSCVRGQDGGHHLLPVCHCRTGRDQNLFTLQLQTTVDSIFFTSNLFRESTVLYQIARIQNCEHQTFVKIFMLFTADRNLKIRKGCFLQFYSDFYLLMFNYSSNSTVLKISRVSMCSKALQRLGTDGCFKAFQ